MKRMVERILIAVFLALAAFNAYGQVTYVTKPNFFACVTKDVFYEIVSNAVNKDKEAAAQLILSGECTILKGGGKVQVMDSTWTGAVKIRPIGQRGTLWTFREAVE